MVSVFSLSAFAGPLLSVGDDSLCSVPDLTGFLLVLVSELQSTLMSFVHIPESTWTDQKGSSSGTDVTWCGTSVTPECDIALGVQKGRLVPAGLLILQGKSCSLLQPLYCHGEVAPGQV